MEERYYYLIKYNKMLCGWILTQLKITLSYYRWYFQTQHNIIYLFFSYFIWTSGKLEHAMYSIKRSMQWDEDVFGLECDLDLYNIVATNDFNMGAMYVILSFLSFQISLEYSIFNNHLLYLIKLLNAHSINTNLCFFHRNI